LFRIDAKLTPKCIAAEVTVSNSPAGAMILIEFGFTLIARLSFSYYPVDRYWQVKKSTFMATYLTKYGQHYFSIDLGDIT
jgi:hypothetical protein